MSSSNTPPALTSLTPAQLRLLTFQILTEHFTSSPETLAKLGMDCANKVLELIMASVELSFPSALRDKYGVDEAAMRAACGLDWEEMERGLVRMETLLEGAIDKRFDLFELFVLRNVFSIPVELIPYVVLEHQVSLPRAGACC